MIFIDKNIVVLMILSPLVAAVFMTLIPSSDLSSKRTISRFFSILGFLLFLRMAYIFVSIKSIVSYDFSLIMPQLNLNFIVLINQQNLFLFGALSAVLMANMLLYELNDIKSNVHQVAPFILTFILLTSFGQKDIRVALPIISVANFIIYFLISYSEQLRRGTAIFRTGIFLFSCDALALVLLQYQAQESSPVFMAISQIAIVLPGLARLTLPLCAPFMKNLFLNLDRSEGPFILAFLHLAGFLVLILSKNELIIDSKILAAIIGVIATYSALHIAVITVSERKTSTIAYYCLTFYSALAVIIIFLFDIKKSWAIYSGLILVNIAIFMHIAKSALLINQYCTLGNYKSRIRATWFLSLSLVLAIPGFGIGTVWWSSLYLIYQEINQMSEPFYSLWIIILLLWVISLIFLSYALILVVRIDLHDEGQLSAAAFEYRTQIKNTFIYSPIFIAILSVVIPIATIYAGTKFP